MLITRYLVARNVAGAALGVGVAVADDGAVGACVACSIAGAAVGVVADMARARGRPVGPFIDIDRVLRGHAAVILRGQARIADRCVADGAAALRVGSGGRKNNQRGKEEFFYHNYLFPMEM